jgi:hypothetical protein
LRFFHLFPISFVRAYQQQVLIFQSRRVWQSRHFWQFFTPRPLPPGFHPIPPKVTQSTQESAEGRRLAFSITQLPNYPFTKFCSGTVKTVAIRIFLFFKEL